MTLYPLTPRRRNVTYNLNQQKACDCSFDGRVEQVDAETLAFLAPKPSVASRKFVWILNAGAALIGITRPLFTGIH